MAEQFNGRRPSAFPRHCRQAINTANLLLEAANRLESDGAGASSIASASTSTRDVGLMESVQQGEMRRLFHYTSRNVRRPKRGKNKLAKKQKTVTWTHTYICLSRPVS